MFNMLIVGAHGYGITDLLAQEKCKRCGGSLQPNWNYCPFCGTTVAGNSQERPVTAGLTLGTVKYEPSGIMGGRGRRLTL